MILLTLILSSIALVLSGISLYFVFNIRNKMNKLDKLADGITWEDLK